MRIRRHVFSVALVLGIVTALMTSAVASARHTGPGGINTQPTTLFAFLLGDNEVPGPGDPDGYGWAYITLDQLNNRVCYSLGAVDIAPAAAAHIHVGGSNVAGPVVVHLAAPTSGASRGCTTASAQLIASILNNPAGYYVNVHNASYPAGAIRGQLGS
jgi:hypothetical protein